MGRVLGSHSTHHFRDHVRPSARSARARRRPTPRSRWAQLAFRTSRRHLDRPAYRSRHQRQARVERFDEGDAEGLRADIRLAMDIGGGQQTRDIAARWPRKLTRWPIPSAALSARKATSVRYAGTAPPVEQAHKWALEAYRKAMVEYRAAKSRNRRAILQSRSSKRI